VFVFDRDILDGLPRRDRRMEFIRESLCELDKALRSAGAAPEAAGLIVRHGVASDEIAALARSLGVQAVFAGRDYEPQALARDARGAWRPGRRRHRAADLQGPRGVRGA